MVFTNRLCRPEDLQATLCIRLLTSSPTLSLSTLNSISSQPVLKIHIHIECRSSNHSDHPLTIRTSGVLIANKPEDGLTDCVAQGAFGAGLVCSNPQDRTRKAISLGNHRLHHARQDGADAVNLRDRSGASFMTIPAQDSGKGTMITHTLSPATCLRVCAKD
ncbi:hypothetical protein T440DRAFT_273817 [Plenodomus tracheiphilus IPT5]|uniref:Uncharacterized protein n=1 Tax=Plenodomus tracheiphilus IPT5 TaxID=1408161 RepID=A0A6A7BG72_9PLEO|nr:hypothetical protein T440DRAFT_273817 [Plenodomus tracheiphilus IPT5]